MLLLLMRHGIAEPLSLENLDDFHRVLTPKGQRRTRKAARGLRRLVPQLDFLASSPKTRARQSAQIVRDAWGKKAPPLIQWSELLEGDWDFWREKLRVLPAQTVLLCGHEPILSAITAQILTGSPFAFAMEWKKAGVCALEIEFEPFEARLLWHLTPRQLRHIGKK